MNIENNLKTSTEVMDFRALHNLFEAAISEYDELVHRVIALANNIKPIKETVSNPPPEVQPDLKEGILATFSMHQRMLQQANNRLHNVVSQLELVIG